MTTQTWPFTLEITEVPTEPGFRGTIDPVTQTIVAGVRAVYQVSFVDVVGGFASPLSLAVLNLPFEAVATFSLPNPVVVTDVVELTIETDLMVAGVYALEIEATWE